MFWRFSKKAVISFVLILILTISTFGVYQYDKNRKISKQFSSLEQEIASLTSTIEQSVNLSASNQAKLNTIESNGKTPTQDDLITSIVSKATPAVVSVIISQNVPFQIPIGKDVGTYNQEIGAGTGFIIRQDGYILTNRHVVSDTEATYTVILSNGTRKNAKVVYRDPNIDMAIIKIDGSGYPTISLGDSSILKLGQTVTAIGNALGEYNNSVSVGIISGLNRDIQAGDQEGNVETLSNVIQTDTPINSGNSGGPLLDLSGKAIGINVAMEDGANDIAFSIPINNIKLTLRNVLK